MPRADSIDPPGPAPFTDPRTYKHKEENLWAPGPAQILGHQNFKVRDTSAVYETMAEVALGPVGPGGGVKVAATAASSGRYLARLMSWFKGLFGRASAKSLGAAAARSNARTTTNAAEVFRRLERFHGIDPATASERLHQIKAATGRGPADNVIFDLTGNIYDELGNWIGSLTEGGARLAR